MNGSYWSAFLMWALCRNLELHDTGLARTGNCRRCGLLILQNGRAL